MAAPEILDSGTALLHGGVSGRTKVQDVNRITGECD